MPVLASHCPEHRFVIVDINEARIAAWQSDQLPIYEPGLEKLFQRNLKEGRLHFTTSLEEGIRDAEIIFFSFTNASRRGRLRRPEVRAGGGRSHWRALNRL